MKKYLLTVATVSLLLSSCGGIESKMKKLAEKECECKAHMQDEKKLEACKKEYDVMKDEVIKEGEKLDQAKKMELDKLYKNTLKECKN